MNAVFILGSQFPDPKILLENFSSISKELNLNYSIVDNENISLYVPDFGDLLEISLESKESFTQKLKDESFVPGYGPLFSVWYNNGGEKEDRTLMPVLKAYLERHPEALIYNDEAGAIPYVFTKNHLSASVDNDFHFLYQNPEDLNPAT